MVRRVASIPLDALLLDLENARHGIQEDQNAVMKWMVSGGNGKKALNLARSFTTHGLGPSELPMVIPAGDGTRQLYRVLEGNRRVAVLKMLQDPEKCPVDSVRTQLRKLRREAKAELPTELECVVFPDLESAAPWIELRHLGEQGGAGTVPWGAKEQEYFAERTGRRGRYSEAMQLLEYGMEKGLIGQEQANRIPITNVARLINTPSVRKELGLSRSKGILYRIADESYVARAIGDVLRELGKPNVTVSRLKTRPDREQFVQRVQQRERWESYEEQSAVPLVKAGTDGSAEQETQTTVKRSRTTRDPLSRRTPIAGSTSMKIKNKRLLAMFRELKSIDAAKFVNASAVLTRVFIEGCIDLYVANEALGLSDEQKRKLAKKGNAVRMHIIDNAGARRQQAKNDLKGLQTFCGDSSSIGSADTFNAVVHNPVFALTERELKVNWDRLESSLKWFEGHV